MNQIICKAIADKQLITFRYKGSMRTVEPHLLGYDGDGDLTLSAWQLVGGSGEGWRDFHVAKMAALSVLDRAFPGSRPGYNRWDETIDRVVCRL